MDGPPRVDPSVKSLFWILITSATVFLCLRLYHKYRGQGLHRDDLVLVASWVALFSNGVVVSVIIDTAASPESGDVPATLSKLILLGHTSTTLAVISQAWSKTSFAMTLLAISYKKDWTTYLLWFAIISMNLSFAAGAVIFWIQCLPLESYWIPGVEGSCLDPSIWIVFGIVTSAYSGILDLVFAALPWRIIMPLHVNTREKIGCAIAMSMGIFAAAAAFIKCSKFPLIAPGATGDNSGDSMQLAIWGVAEPAVTIMAASVPALTLFVRKVASSKESVTASGSV